MTTISRSVLLDGVELPYEDGDTLMQASVRAGRAIPHLCWHEGLGAHASCRLCVVRVDGRMNAACATRAAAGQVVESEVPDLQARRRSMLQMLFVEGNHFCPSCERSGSCHLQGTAYDAGMLGPHWEEFYPSREVDASHPEVLLDRNRCILCGLCVRASHEVDGKGVFEIGGHGIGAHLVVNSPDGLLGGSTLRRDDLAARICPVGALMPKRVGFSIPIGQRPHDVAPEAVAPPPQPAPVPAALPDAPPPPPRKPRIATVSLAGCFGCHMSLLDIDERLLALVDVIELDRSPLTDLKQVGDLGDCDIGLIEGGLCNSENVEVLREFRARCKVLVAVGACAVNGGLPAQRNALDVQDVLRSVYLTGPGLSPGARIPDDPELPLLLAQVRPLHEVVRIDHVLPGCPPTADAIWALLTALLDGRPPQLARAELRYD
ncbi:2Fe-2S iron-sulfur cluster-binding protein [Sphaerotilus sp.]|uniref:NADH-quinone oxidoreductase subunit B family protein n=1 Tax=Sphaerotilus sp. TaxID=2093942 RepID=UPI002ACD4A5E|nr:2Fe-2S iron-sulfur cluster-binding protein [Sphaerotilus sp.]MDZ7858733.1 2Fe-2S iron-sulfur cluster-binding protein [Sphaerotilus sp.]